MLEILPWIQAACFLIALIPIPGLQVFAAIGAALEVLSITLAAVKLLTATELHRRGKLSDGELIQNQMDLAFDILPGPPVNRLLKTGARAAKRVAKRVQSVSRRFANVKFTGHVDDMLRGGAKTTRTYSTKLSEAWEDAAPRTAKVVRQGGEVTAQVMEKSADVVEVLELPLQATEAVIDEVISRSGDVQRVVVDSVADAVIESAEHIDYGNILSSDSVKAAIKDDVLEYVDRPCKPGEQCVLVACEARE